MAFVVSGPASTDAIAVIAASILNGTPATFSGGKGGFRATLKSESVEFISSFGALAYFITSKKTDQSFEEYLNALELLSLCSDVAVNGASVLPTIESLLKATNGASILSAPSVIDFAFVGALSKAVEKKAISLPLESFPLVSTFFNNIITGDTWKKSVSLVDAPVKTAASAPAKAASKEKGGKGNNAPSAESILALSTYNTTATVSTADEKLMSCCIEYELAEIFTRAIETAFPQTVAMKAANPDIHINTSLQFVHHYQCNGALSLFSKLKGPSAKKDKKAKDASPADPVVPAEPVAPADPNAVVPTSPVHCAQLIIAAVEAAGPHSLIGKLEVSGPGYINIYLAANFVSARLASTLEYGVRAGLAPGERVRRVVVDYSSPNIAKEMHIGHLRSTIIGDAIARILEFAGHHVERVNHVGDWGTQFGMLIAYLKDLLASGSVTDAELDTNISDLTAFYKAAKKRFDEDAEFKQRAQLEVVALQAGNEENLALWRRMVRVSADMFKRVYEMLGVSDRLYIKGESFYNPLIPDMVEELNGKGLLTESEGALLCFVEGQAVPLIVRKSDGGFGYDSTDLTALKYRLLSPESDADWVIAVVDAGQSLHFDLVFAGGRAAGWYGPGCIDPRKADARVQHVSFGVVQGEDKKRLKTRSGDSVKLFDVLEEARQRAHAVITERVAAGSTPLSQDEIEHAAKILGYGGVKYFDLRQHRTSDYVFSYERMLSPDGDTAVYMEYAHARLMSILRKARDIGIDVDAVASVFDPAGFRFEHPSEIKLAAEIIRFSDVVADVLKELYPHRIAEFLYALCSKITDFHRDCNVLGANTAPEVRDSRIRLCVAAGKVMKQAMILLGIEPLEKI